MGKNTRDDFHLAITMGDPAGVGSEIILKALANKNIGKNVKITIIGTTWLLETIYQKLAQQGIKQITNPDKLSIIDLPLTQSIEFGQGNKDTGAVSFAYLARAIAGALSGEFDAIVTAPIAKSLWQMAGYNYPGQTEVLAEYAGVEKYGMLFVGRSPFTGWTLRTLLATTHIPLAEVSTTLNPQLMSLKLDLLRECLINNFAIKNPTIAIAGLNPHSGEEGKLGKEEQQWLIPWLKTAQKQYPDLNLIGPIPPDTMWVKAGEAWYQNSNLNPADAYLALYHDQGLIPVKLMAFEQAINTTIGLPFIRTSPDHGTAFDIAGKGIANPTSMEAAIKLAIAFLSHK